jgi:methyl-accepting chemotaxis protein
MSERPASSRARIGGSFGSRLTLMLVAAALLPLVSLAVLLAALGVLRDPAVARVVLAAGAIAAALAILSAYVLSAELTAPLRAIVRAVERVAAGDLATTIQLDGDGPERCGHISACGREVVRQLW